MPKQVSFTFVERYLKSNGYRLLWERPYLDIPGARFVVFGHEGKPLIGFPEVRGSVLRNHWERVRLLVDLHGEEDE